MRPTPPTVVRTFGADMPPTHGDADDDHRDTSGRCSTDEMLARFDERAPQLRPREPLLRRGLRGAARQRATCTASLPDRVRRRRARPRRDQPAAAPPRLRRPGDRRRRQHAPLLVGLCADLHRAGDPSRRLDARAGRRRATSSPPATARPATTSRCCCRRPSAERVDGGWEITGHKIFGSLSPVWTYLGVHAHGHQRSRRTRRSSTASSTATRPATASSETWDTLGMRATDVATTRSSTARSCPTRRSILVCPAGFAGAGLFHVALFAWALLGFAARLLGDRPAGVRRHRRPDARAHVDRADPLDGPPPRGAAPRRRDAHPPRGDRRPPRPGVRRLGRPASTTAWTGRPRSSPASTTSSTRAWAVVDTALDLTGGVGHLQAQPARAAVPRRPPRAASTPATRMLAHELVGKLSLGINPDEQPRWG